MRENTDLQKLNKIRTASFECDKCHNLYFYLSNGFLQSSVKRLCELGVVKYNRPTDNFFVDWDKYHEVKNKATSYKATSYSSSTKSF